MIASDPQENSAEREPDQFIYCSKVSSSNTYKGIGVRATKAEEASYVKVRGRLLICQIR
ncbi:hypothetical protein BVRB_5g124750 [Beta vulgaris subsp. vulgaris]|uniref:Uncharacterized protein n=1 Tax=Beta vulgaris subsp. vulgaris TaxID=3555 RepID=A0A0J8B9R1_BETVV|nr:hypothetical protein BVRB_5g124750 [Beta vulgaris subsp. vulgaris]